MAQNLFDKKTLTKWLEVDKAFKVFSSIITCIFSRILKVILPHH